MGGKENSSLVLIEQIVSFYDNCPPYDDKFNSKYYTAER